MNLEVVWDTETKRAKITWEEGPRRTTLFCAIDEVSDQYLLLHVAPPEESK